MKLVRDAEERLEVIHLVGVDVQPHLAGEHLREGLELQITLGRRALLAAFFPGLPLRSVVLGVVELLANDGRLAHERRGRLALAPVAALLILTPGPLHAGRRASELYLVERLPAVQLDDGRPAADVVAAARQDLHRGNATRGGARDLRVVGVDGVFRADLGFDVAGHLVSVRVGLELRQRVNPKVRVRVHESGQDVFAARLDHVGAGRGLNVLAHGRDLTLVDDHRSVFDGPVGHGEDCRALDHHRTFLGLRPGGGEKREGHRHYGVLLESKHWLTPAEVGARPS